MGKKKKKIIAGDCETDPFKYGRKLAPFVWGIYDDGFQYFWGENCTEQFVDYLSTEKDVIVYMHNGGKFDFHFLLPYLDPVLSIINGRIAKATMFGGAVELRDSYLILPLPLSAYNKDEIDYAHMESEVREIHKSEILDYLKTDCYSLFKWVTDFIDHFGSGLTLAGSAFKQLKKTDYEVANTYDDFDKKYRQFYMGGRVQCFEVGEFHGKFEYVDINSAYPRAMNEKHWWGSNVREHLRLPDIDNGSWYAEISAISKGCLPYKHHSKHGAWPKLDQDKGKLYFPDDNKIRRYYASGWEINKGLETNTLKIIKTYRTYRPLFTKDFREYVAKFFDMKNEADREMKKHAKGSESYLYWSTRRQFAKLMLNSCYGKFGQDGRKFKKFELREPGYTYLCAKHEAENCLMCRDHFTLYEKKPDLWIFSKDDPVDRFFNVATAGSVTAWVRAYLWGNIVTSERPLYCDTDSLMCQKFNGPVTQNIGDWERECYLHELYIAQRKMYAGKYYKKQWPFVDTKIASKGVRLTFNEIKNGVIKKQKLTYKKDAPAFSLKYGSRYQEKTIDFENIQNSACNNPD